MLKFFKIFNKKNQANYTVTNDMRNLQTDKTLVHSSFLKQNILGFLSCLFILLFSWVLKIIMVAKYFTFQNQFLFLLFFALSMIFLALMLFLLQKQLLQWWILGFIFCSLILFLDVIPLNNIYFYILIIISFVYLFITSIFYHKSDELYLRFDWKTVFRSGFSHQFISVMILFIAIIFFGFIKIDNKMVKGWSLSNIVQSGLEIWTNFKPTSSLNQPFDSVINNFLTKNQFLNNLQQQYSFLGVSGNKIVSDNIKSMFKTNFDGKTKLSQILIEYFNKSSQHIKTIIFSIFLWFIFSIVGFFYFVSRIVIYYLSYIIINILIWTGFLKLEEKPTVKQYLVLK